MNIAIFGLGYVGAVSLACLARDGSNVIGVDVDETKRDLIKAGRSPVIEEGMQELLAEVVTGGRVRVSADVGPAIESADVSFVCVGTPSSSNGSQDLSAIRRVCEEIGTAIGEKGKRHVVVIRSTVQPGTLDKEVRPALERASGMRVGETIGLCFQPEFLREGSSIRDYDNPPFTVVGGDSDESIGTVRRLFNHLPCEFISTDIKTAEMLKYACNTWHALKVTFSNEIGRIAQALGLSSHNVMELVCKDTQLNISPAYMKPGFAFGGSCLPKDLKALLYIANRSDVDVPMLQGILPSNQLHIEHALDIVLRWGRKKIGMVGLSFKSGTDDLRESPMVTLAERLIGKGADLAIYDPEVNVSRLVGANRKYIEGTIPHIASVMVDRCEDLVHGSEIIIVGLRDKSLAELIANSAREDQVILDLVGMSGADRVRARYEGVCW